MSAAPGSHILHVKCWGQKVHDEELLNITVKSGASSSDIKVGAPTVGASLASPFTMSASVNTCASKPAVSMGYSLDGGKP